MICSGKLYYELAQRREDLKARDIVILRVEQLYPFPRARLEELVNRYPTVDQWCWVQEEPANMGAWSFIGPRLEILLDGPVRYIGRKTSSSPATGYPKVYRREQAAIIEEAIGPPADQLKASDRYQGG
jgi:2-oxoglutarate dehydrogenase E1 component